MTPEQIEFVRKVLDDLARENAGNGECSCRCCVLEGAGAEFIRLHDAIQRLYAMTPNDVQREADFLDVRPGLLAHTVEQIVRRYVQ